MKHCRGLYMGTDLVCLQIESAAKACRSLTMNDFVSTEASLMLMVYGVARTTQSDSAPRR
jgi:hypothetical protein